MMATKLDNRSVADATDRAQTLFDLASARIASQASCMIEEDESLSWATFAQRSRAMATGLAGLGVGRGDRVAIWLPNRSAWLVSCFACAQLGAIAVSINTRFRSAEVGDLLFRSGAKILIYWPTYKDIDFAGILASCSNEAVGKLETLVLYEEEDRPQPPSVAGKPAVPFARLLNSPPMSVNHGTPDDPCVIFTTSGTTKAPKLVLHSQRNVLAHGFNVVQQYGMSPASRFLLVPPFCGVYGFCSAMIALVAGAPLILTPTWNPALYVQLLQTHRATHLTASNEAVAQLLDACPDDKVLSSIAFVVCANLNPAYADIVERGERRRVEVVNLYGSSEMQALLSLADRTASAEIRGRPGGIFASARARVRARDPETGKICPPGEAGELEFFAPESRFVGYLNDAEATSAAITEDGYFRSGDLGYVEPDGSFAYLARMGDTLRLGGFLVSPAEIEDLVQQHPTVESCQIVGVQFRGAVRPIAFVIARAGATVNEQDIISHTAERLAKYKVPAKVFVVDEFPTTPSANGSKVQRTKLRDDAEARLRSLS
jgi:fatty-acyl-CoA synthase